MKLSKILVPVDFSEMSKRAARHATALAHPFGAELTLLHVNAFPAGISSLPNESGGVIDSGWVTAMEARRYHELEAFEPGAFEGLKVHRFVVSGDPARRITEYARHERPDLIVMATHGYGPFRRFLLGSVTAKVLHDVDCPVWTGAHFDDSYTTAWSGIHHVLCAIDNGPASDRVLAWAAGFAAQCECPVSVVHAIPKLEQEDLIDEEARLQRISGAETQARCLQRKAGLQADVRIEEGEPGKAVAAAAARLHAELLVIGRSPQSALGGRLRTDAYSIVRQAPCPVVSV